MRASTPTQLLLTGNGKIASRSCHKAIVRKHESLCTKDAPRIGKYFCFLWLRIIADALINTLLQYEKNRVTFTMFRRHYKHSI